MPSSAEPVLQVQDVSKLYPFGHGQAVSALDHVNLEIYKGETLGLVGESGCGKSTLAKILMALEHPTSGAVLYEGTDLALIRRRRYRRDLRRKIQMVFQDPYGSLNPRLTVEQIIGEAYKIHPDLQPRSKRAGAIKDLLEMVGLDPDHANRRPHQFSGGQRQRIGIARALAVRPKVLICDEPVAALDVSVQAQIVNLLDSLRAEFDLTCVFISHDLSIVRHISDRVAVMYLGRVMEVGTHEDIHQAPSHPYTQALLSAVPVPDPSRRHQRQEIVLEGDVPSPADPPPGCRFSTRCWKATERCTSVVPELEAREGLRQLVACHYPEKRVPQYDDAAEGA